MKEVYIVSARRTPIGGLMGSLSHLSATRLGALAIKDAYQYAGIAPGDIDEVYMGHVLSAGAGQSPARQAAIFADIPVTVDATTINKVCASGMKAVMIAARQIESGAGEVIMAGGMESMSNTPHYQHIRRPHKYGHATLTDGMIKDGLWDVYNDYHMGSAAELCARTYGISREAQDEYALLSYERAAKATALGKFRNEIIPIEVHAKKEVTRITADEDIYKVIPEKVPTLSPAFEEGGTVTAANASNLNDGAAALLLVSKESVDKLNLRPLARIISYADAAQAPEWFTTSPSVAIPKALKLAGLSLADIDLFEINEAYSAVAIANRNILEIDPTRINIYGGAVAMGHPLGASGARIICTLISGLKQEGGKYGIAAICNGGGGASAIIIENI